MHTEVKKISGDEWRLMAASAHLVCFNEKIEPDFNNIDFALLNVRGDAPLNYCTVRELDKESCYWQYGGAFPSSKGTVQSYLSYKRNAEWCLANGYKRVTTYIENTNLPMIKIALKVGFKIIGTRMFKGSVLVEFLLEKVEDDYKYDGK